MNCDEYREQVGADPSEAFDGGAAHAASCSSCSGWRDEMRALDATIAKALAIDVPELVLPDLPAIASSAGVVDLETRRKRVFRSPTWLGIAAAVAIVGVFAVRLLTQQPAYPRLAEDILAHIAHEPQALAATAPVADDVLQRAMGARAEMAPAAGLVTYARSCIIHGNAIPHLVIQGEAGPVTLLLLPDERVDAAVPIEGEILRGVILPVGDGSIAIVGERDEPLGKLQKRVMESVHWKI